MVGMATTFRPNSRNTCPTPGCDNPRGQGFGGTCTTCSSPESDEAARLAWRSKAERLALAGLGLTEAQS